MQKNISALGVWEANSWEMMSFCCKIMKFYALGSWLKPHSWSRGGIPLSDGDNMFRFGQHALRRVWKHLIEPKRDEQQPWGEGAVSDYETVERSGLISFREVKGMWSLCWRRLWERTEQSPILQQQGRGNQLQWNIFVTYFGKKTSGGRRVGEHCKRNLFHRRFCNQSEPTHISSSLHLCPIHAAAHSVPASSHPSSCALLHPGWLYWWTWAESWQGKSITNPCNSSGTGGSSKSTVVKPWPGGTTLGVKGCSILWKSVIL